MGNKIGIGIITCNRPDFFEKCLESIPIDRIDHMVIVNDGDSGLDITPVNDMISKVNVIEHETNQGVGKSKNDALRYLLSKNCDYMFILEDDIVILKKNVFNKYIDAHKASGIHHFNYGPGSPFNRKQTVKSCDLHNRHLLDQHTDPNPKMIIDYNKHTKVSLFEHTVAMFSFYTNKVLNEVGLIDEDYYNAWEHVDHTYRIINMGYHPPFWYFADIYNSHKYVSELPDAINSSSIACNSKQWEKNVLSGREIYKKKHGHYPNQVKMVDKDSVVKDLKIMKGMISN